MRPLRRGPLLWRVRPRARAPVRRARRGKELPLPPRRDVPPRGRRRRRARLLRPAREPLPGIQEPPRVPRGLRLPQRDQPPELTAMRRLPFRRFASPLAGLLALAGVGLFAGRADAASAVLSKDGTLYEVFEAPYGQIITGASASDAALPVLGLRTTPSGGIPAVEVVGGTVNDLVKLGESLEFEETTQSVFVVYTRLQGFFLDVHVAMHRSGAWSEVRLLPNPGLYVSMNPQLLVTRQTYTDADDTGQPVTKSRTILSIVWWEESDTSQARYAPIFIEDGSAGLDDVTVWNLNDLSGSTGPTDNSGLPMSSYVYPALQRDAGTNGGVLVSFANLAVRQQMVIHLSFPDNLLILVPPDGLTATQRTAYARGYSPIGRAFSMMQLPTQMDLSFLTQVGTVISPAGVP